MVVISCFDSSVSCYLFTLYSMSSSAICLIEPSILPFLVPYCLDLTCINDPIWTNKKYKYDGVIQR